MVGASGAVGRWMKMMRTTTMMMAMASGVEQRIKSAAAVVAVASMHYDN